MRRIVVDMLFDLSNNPSNATKHPTDERRAVAGGSEYQGNGFAAGRLTGFQADDQRGETTRPEHGPKGIAPPSWGFSSKRLVRLSVVSSFRHVSRSRDQNWSEKVTQIAIGMSMRAV